MNINLKYAKSSRYNTQVPYIANDILPYKNMIFFLPNDIGTQSHSLTQ